MGDQKKEAKKQRARRHPGKKPGKAALFFFTFSGVLLCGLFALFLFAHFRSARSKAEVELSLLPKTEAVPLAAPVSPPTAEPAEEGLNNGRYDDALNDPEYLEANHIFVKEAHTEAVVTLSFTGDLLFDENYAVMANLKQRGGVLSDAISADALMVMQNSDLLIVNNEFPYTNRGTPLPKKQFTFRADPGTVSYLTEMGADIAILANNHIYDYGEQGLFDTLDTLADAEIVPLGAGRNLEEASRTIYYIINDIKIALIAATQIERLSVPDTPGATEDSSGTFRCWTEDLIYERIAEAKENADFVVVCIHWGTEKETEPDTYQLAQAPRLAEAGADLIIGDHPHVLQGVSYFGDTPCLYSLGNFWFNSSTLDTVLVQAAVDREGLKSLRFYPAVQSGCKTALVFNEESDRILDQLRVLSPGAAIDSDGFITKK